MQKWEGVFSYNFPNNVWQKAFHNANDPQDSYCYERAFCGHQHWVSVERRSKNDERSETYFVLNGVVCLVVRESVVVRRTAVVSCDFS